MMSNPVRISLPYGNDTLELELPAQNLIKVASPADVTPRANCATLVREALRHPAGVQPLSACVKEGQKLLILVDDNTRPTPVAEVLPEVLAGFPFEFCRQDAGSTFELASPQPI